MSKQSDKSDAKLTANDVDAFNAITGAIQSAAEVKRDKARAANKRAYAKKKALKDAAKARLANDVSVDVPYDRKSITGPSFGSNSMRDGIPAVQLVMSDNAVGPSMGGYIQSPLYVMKSGSTGTPKNAFTRLMDAQTEFRENGVTPQWFIITADGVSILDPYLVDNLLALHDYTHAVGTLGVSAIRRSGKFYRPGDASEVKGAVIQGNKEQRTSEYKQAPDYSTADAFQVAAITSGMIAIRGATFMDIDFTQLADAINDGAQHFIADLSMEVNRRGFVVGVMKTLIRQEDTISRHTDSPIFKQDQDVFARKWARYLPIRF